MVFKRAFLLFTLLIFACSSSNETDVNQIEMNDVEVNEVIITDTFYITLNEDSSLDDYWKIFLADAIRSGRLDPGLNRTVNLFFGDEPDFASGVTADHAGRAHSICNNEVISFEIIESFREDYTIVQRLFTFYHEAGHARYNYRHPCEFNETCATNTSENFPIMWRTIPLGNTTLEQFINHKNDFFGRRWEGVRYLNCM